MNQEQEILEELSQGSREALTKIYKDYRQPFIHWSVSTYALSTDDAKDLYQTTVILFYENVLNKKLTTLNSSLKTYLFAIGKNKIREHLRKTGKTFIGLDSVPDQPYYDDILTDDDTDKKSYAIFKKCLDALGDPCKNVLVSFYYKNFTMAEIADAFDYKNEATAKNSKYKCLQRLKACFFNTINQSDGQN